MRLLGRLGPAFVEFGRFLAVCPDLIPSAFRDELLEQEVFGKPLPWADVRAILSVEFKESAALFESIDPRSVACGPLHQLHRAVTRAGSRVLIKILRPEALRARGTLPRADLLVRLAGVLGPQVLSSRRELLDEWKAWYEAELNITGELAALTSLANAVPEDSSLRIPRAWPELSTPRVLTFEDLGGIPLTDVLAPSRRSGQQPLDDYGFDTKDLARHLLKSTVQQIFGRSFYNTAVHPRSIVVLPGNRYSFLSFAHCESSDPSVLSLHARFLEGIFRSELPGQFRMLEEILDGGDSADIEGMRSDFIRDSLLWLRGDSSPSPRRGTRTYGSPLSSWMLAILRGARRNGYHPPREMRAAFRTLSSIEWIANRLDAGVHLQSTGMESLADVRLDEALRILEPEVPYNALSDLLTMLSAMPERLNRILSDSLKGRLAAGVNVTEQEQSGAMRDRRSTMIAAGIAAIGIAWLMGEPGIPRIGSASPVTILVPILALIYLYILVQWRKMGR